MILAISPAALFLAQAPHVEIDFNVMRSDDWKGERIDKIAPADLIKRVIRVKETGFARDSDASGEQADYDALFTHLLDSTATATGWGVCPDEVKLADLLILRKEASILCIEAVDTPATPSSPTAIHIRGRGRGARTGLRGFKHPDRRK